MTNQTASLNVVLTDKFSILHILDKKEKKREIVEETVRDPPRSIFLDVDEPYTRRIIANAFRRRFNDESFSVTLGPGSGMDDILLPYGCDFQWAEYERIDWESVLAGKHGASSYCVRKGLSRKAQLAYYTHRYVIKNPTSILKDAIPQTVIIDTWSVWEQGMANSNQQGLADVVEAKANEGTCGNGTNQREALEKCLIQAHQAMDSAEQEYKMWTCGPTFDTDKPNKKCPPMWILKGSTVNKGAGIYLVHIYEQLVDILWSADFIREWYEAFLR